MIDVLRWIKRGLDRLLFACFRQLFTVLPPAGRQAIVIIRTDGIGDLVYFLPVLQKIRTRFRDSRLVLVCRSEAAPILPASLADVLVPFGYLRYRWNYFYRLSVLRRIRSYSPSLTLYCSYHRQHIGDEMAICSGADRTIAFDGNDEIIHPAVRKRNNSFYSDLLPVEDHIPEKVRYDFLLRSLGITMGGGKEALPATMPSDEFLGTFPWLGESKYVVVAPGGSAPIRRWPVKAFTMLGDQLARRTGWRIVLCGGSEDRELVTAIASGMKSSPGLFLGEELPAVARLVSSASLFVGNESGLLHVAASCGTPAVGILGGGHFSRYFPYGSVRIVNHALDCYECNWSCPYPEPYCLTNITVEDAMREAERLIG